MSVYHVLGKAISALKHDQTQDNQSAVMIGPKSNPSFQEITVTAWHQDCSMFGCPKKTTAGWRAIFTLVPAPVGMVN